MIMPRFWLKVLVTYVFIVTCILVVKLVLQGRIINVIDTGNRAFIKDKHLKKTKMQHEVEQKLKDKMVALEDVEQSARNIFYIESSCATRESTYQSGGTARFPLSARQGCSVESTAKLNPSRPVYVLYTCPLAPTLPPHARPLLDLPNVFLVPLRMRQALQDSPVLGLYLSGRMEDSLYPVVHASDVLRLVVLWKFGGTYCDLDTLSVKPLDQLGSNFCGLEGPKDVANAVLNVQPHGNGHEILTRILYKVGKEFNGQSWSGNGPHLITNSMLKECNATDDTLSQCKVFTIFNTTILFPLPYEQYESFFSDSQGPDTVHFIKASGSYMVHFWNNLSSKLDIRVNSSQAYALLADEFCPGTYRNCGYKF